MTRQELIEKIVDELEDNDCFETGNFHTIEGQRREITKTIEQILSEYLIIEGHEVK